MTSETSSGRRDRAARAAVAATVAAAAVVVVGGAVALATDDGGDPAAGQPIAATATTIDSGDGGTTTVAPDSGDGADGPATGHDHDGVAPDGTDDGSGGSGGSAGSTGGPGGGAGRPADRRGDGAHAGHRHPTLAPYEERLADATPEERAAAEELRADVREAVAPYADVDAAVAAGYRPPRHPHGRLAHYVNPALVRDGAVLDPAHPEGLVYRTDEGGEPVLFGAFFVAPPDATAPTPAGDLVVWHSHAETCPGFFATAEEPCTSSRRMLHAWTVDELEITTRTGRTVDVRVTDPFGAPFTASIAPVA